MNLQELKQFEGTPVGERLRKFLQSLEELGVDYNVHRIRQDHMRSYGHPVDTSPGTAIRLDIHLTEDLEDS